MPLPARFSPATRHWFDGAFAEPTAAQLGAWEAIADGRHTLVVAPTGSGKTLAAFLWALDRLAAGTPPPEPMRRCRVLYVSPLKALAVDVGRNLRSPLTGIAQASRRLGLAEPDVTVAMRSGDTPANERRQFARRPSDILITTPESLFLLLTSQAREALAAVETVIVDEVHAVAGTKRGAHLALSLERLDEMLDGPSQRIGLSATVRPVDTVAAFLGGGRAVQVVAPPSNKQFDLRVEVPVDDMAELGAGVGEVSGSAAGAEQRASIWPHVEERVLDLIEAHQSTLVFANSRRLAERLTARLNEGAAERSGLPELAPGDRPPAQSPAQSPTAMGLAEPSQVVARAHHGSVSKEQRALIEDDLKSGRLPAVVATSSLELGIDMGAVDLVVQVEAPPSVASGLQRVGRAGHQVGAVSRGVIFPKYRGDLVASAVAVEGMRSGRIEALSVPQNPLDVLAQQVVAMAAMDEWHVDALLALVRRAHPYAALPQSAFDAVLDLLSGRYPSDEFAELRPRIVWDRVAGTVTGRPGAQRLAVTSGGTIPDRGLFGVFMVGQDGSRVGELDEEMVYESRVGDVFALGATSWRIEDITHDRVLVSPAPGQPGRLPYWHGDSIGRPAEMGRALGAFVREVASLSPARAVERAVRAGLDDRAARNLVDYLAQQRSATGHVPDDRTVLVERFRDELGDWRLVVHTPFGARVHAPWALAVGSRLRERYGVDVAAAHSDDGMVFRIPDTLADPVGYGLSAPADSAADAPSADLVLLDPDEVDALVTAEVGSSALFASRFRECAARALLLPRRNPGRRSPLWQQRQRSAQLLTVAAQHGTFPILLETMRECLQDVYDMGELVAVTSAIRSGEISVAEVETSEPSPFARSLLFGYVAAFMYEGDSPLAERRAQALTLDASLLAELLGRAELRELLDPEVIAATEAELQRTAPQRRARDVEGVADLLRLLGPLSAAEIAERCSDADVASEAPQKLVTARRAIAVRVAGEMRFAAIEDAGRLRDALGVALPVGVPEAFTEVVADPLGDLVSRFARRHTPFAVAEVASRFGLGTAVARDVLTSLAARGRLTEGEFRPGGTGTEWCDPDVLRMLRRRSLAALRQEAEPVSQATLARFLPAWQHVGSRLRGPSGVLTVVEQLAGYPLPASGLEPLVLASRVEGYEPGWLDELTAAGEVLWAGHGSLPGADGWLSLHLADDAALTLPDLAPLDALADDETVIARLATVLRNGGGRFFRAVLAEVDAEPGEVEQALWTLVWAGYVTNDTLAPVRTRLGGGSRASGARSRARRSAYRPGGRRSRFALTPRSGTASVGSAASAASPGGLSGRWSWLDDREPDPTLRSHASAQLLLDRHGVLTRGAVSAERVPGGFAATYRVLAAAEESGRCRRGYVVEGLGGAQFALPGAVDRLRRLADVEQNALAEGAVVLSAADPANPYGAALAWPDPSAAGHRPGRKAGAVVVLVDGALVLFVERGGRSLLSFSDEPEVLRVAGAALARTVRRGALGRVTVQRADGESTMGGVVADALSSAGFHLTPRGLRLRPDAAPR